jgi:hypothetical protein
MQGDWGWGGGCGVSANEYRCAHHVTWSPSKLWRSTSIFNLFLTVLGIREHFGADPDPTPDPTPFLNDFKDVKKIMFFIFFLITYPLVPIIPYIIFSLKN